MLNWGRHHAQCLPAWKQSGPMGPSRPMLSHLGPILGLCWAKSGPCWAMLGPSWAYIGPGWAYVGSCRAILGAMLGPCLGHLCWNDRTMPFFPSRAPSWSSKPRKNRCFSTSPRWNSLPPRGPKHRKKTKFLTPQAKYTVNYRDFSWPGVVQGWVGGRAGSPYNLWVYHRRPPARTRAGLVAGARI